MSLETRVGRAVLDLSDIVKTNVVSAVARARTEGKLTLSDKDLTVTANIITSAIDATMRDGVDMLIRLVK
jgi:predicted homoserine dehydrogenase-like protein